MTCIIYDLLVTDLSFLETAFGLVYVFHDCLYDNKGLQHYPCIVPFILSIFQTSISHMETPLYNLLAS